MRAISSYVKIDENITELNDEVNIIENTQPRRVLKTKQNSKSVDLLDFGQSEDLEKVPEEETQQKTKSFVRFNN